MITPAIYNIIKEAIDTAHNEYILSEVKRFEYRNAKDIGKERIDYNKLEDVKEAFINPKTGRVNHKRLVEDMQDISIPKKCIIRSLTML